ncbi:NAD(P)H-dependent flavin oxidoreductase [Mycolicibacterium elephantis]
MISTDWSARMGLTVPIVNAPMGGVAGGALAAAVSRAGGLGMLGLGSSASLSQLETGLHELSELESPFGIGLVDWVAAAEPRLLDAAIAARPALLSVGFGDDFSWVAPARDAGVTTATQVGDLAAAQRAVDAGVDVLIARGAEGGGHGAPLVGTLPLLTSVLDRYSVPVLAAGGISSGRGVAAVLAAGAAGAWVGTAFSACLEASVSPAVRTQLLAARDTDTVTTRVFDVAQGYPWPATLPERVLRNAFSDTWDGREAELTDAERDALAAAVAAEDHRLAPINAGQGVGVLDTVESAAEVVARLGAEAKRLLGRWGETG